MNKCSEKVLLKKLKLRYEFTKFMLKEFKNESNPQNLAIYNNYVGEEKILNAVIKYIENDTVYLNILTSFKQENQHGS